jgi:hypothetical protein
VTTKNTVFWDITPCGSCENRHIGGKYRGRHHHGETVFLRSVLQSLVTANVLPSSLIFSLWWWRRYVPPWRRFSQEPHGVTSQKSAFLIMIRCPYRTAVELSVNDWLLAGRPTVLSLSSFMVKIFHSSISSRLALEPIHLPIYWALWGFSGGKAVGAWSLSLTFKFNRGQENVNRFIHSHISRNGIVHKKNFTFVVIFLGIEPRFLGHSTRSLSLCALSLFHSFQ